MENLAVKKFCSFQWAELLHHHQKSTASSGMLLRGSSCHQPRGSTMREDYTRLSREFFFGLMKRGNELTVFCANPGGNDYLKLLLDIVGNG